MNMLSRIFHSLRTFAGLADPSEPHLIPDHGWLQATPADARRLRAEADARAELARKAGP
jgi:hypothetical protein